MARTHYTQGTIFASENPGAFVVSADSGETLLIPRNVVDTMRITEQDIGMAVKAAYFQSASGDFVCASLSRDLSGVPLDEFEIEVHARLERVERLLYTVLSSVAERR